MIKPKKSSVRYASSSANLILGMAVYQMLRYVFWKNNRYLPHDKDLLAALTDLDPELSSLTASLNGSHLGRILHDPARLSDASN